MPVIKVYLHFVWATKQRTPFLYSKPIRDRVWQHINENARKQHIHVITTGGFSNHCHCLLSMSKDHCIWKLANLIKGESSNWINRTRLISHFFQSESFEWQDGYYVESVSPKSLENIKLYIQTQEEHHLQYPFEEEFSSDPDTTETLA